MEERISRAEAAQILCVTIEQLRGIVDRGLLSVFQPPGCHYKLFRGEVERLARKSYRPARVTDDTAA
jgi:hypothetical protein